MHCKGTSLHLSVILNQEKYDIQSGLLLLLLLFSFISVHLIVYVLYYNYFEDEISWFLQQSWLLKSCISFFQRILICITMCQQIATKQKQITGICLQVSQTISSSVFRFIFENLKMWCTQHAGWNLLNYSNSYFEGEFIFAPGKVLIKLGYQVPNQLVKDIIASKPGQIERFLYTLRHKVCLSWKLEILTPDNYNLWSFLPS